MRFKAWDTKYKEYIADFLITSDGEVMITDDRCGACDQDFYYVPEHEIRLETLTTEQSD